MTSALPFRPWRVTTYGDLKVGDICRFPDRDSPVSFIEDAGNGWVTIVLGGKCVDRRANDAVTVWGRSC